MYPHCSDCDGSTNCLLGVIIHFGASQSTPLHRVAYATSSHIYLSYCSESIRCDDPIVCVQTVDVVRTDRSHSSFVLPVLFFDRSTTTYADHYQHPTWLISMRKSANLLLYASQWGTSPFQPTQRAILCVEGGF